MTTLSFNLLELHVAHTELVYPLELLFLYFYPGMPSFSRQYLKYTRFRRKRSVLNKSWRFELLNSFLIFSFSTDSTKFVVLMNSFSFSKKAISSKAFQAMLAFKSNELRLYVRVLWHALSLVYSPLAFILSFTSHIHCSLIVLLLLKIYELMFVHLFGLFLGATENQVTDWYTSLYGLLVTPGSQPFTKMHICCGV